MIIAINLNSISLTMSLLSGRADCSKTNDISFMLLVFFILIIHKHLCVEDIYLLDPNSLSAKYYLQ